MLQGRCAGGKVRPRCVGGIGGVWRSVVACARFPKERVLHRCSRGYPRSRVVVEHLLDQVLELDVVVH